MRAITSYVSIEFIIEYDTYCFCVQSTKMFGVALCRTELGSEDKLPPVVERLLTHIEQTGLYTEGLYRKIGAKARINQIIKDLDISIALCLFYHLPFTCFYRLYLSCFFSYSFAYV
jgi:hypothetical protein